MVLEVKVERKLLGEWGSGLGFKERGGFLDDSVYMVCLMGLVDIEFDMGVYWGLYVVDVGVEMWGGGEG